MFNRQLPPEKMIITIIATFLFCSHRHQSQALIAPLFNSQHHHHHTRNGNTRQQQPSTTLSSSSSSPDITATKPHTYGIIGHNIAYSVSPQMHNTAFRTLSLPHNYLLIDIENVDDFFSGPLWNSDDFKGASVTIPHKLNVIPYVDELSDAARAVGSVNTLVKKESDGGSVMVLGDNTDWIGLKTPLEKRIGDGGGVALILGGGGTARAAAYAAQQLGLERVYYNRTPEKAKELAETFGGVVVEDLTAAGALGQLLSSSSSSSPLRVVISTLPASVGFELPEWIIKMTPVVFDVNYKPYHTALLTQAELGGCDVVRGSEMLWEQGVGQFELWMGRKAPYEVMKGVVLENCLPKEEL